MNRRVFIKTTSSAAAATIILPSLSCRRRDPETGLILYTVRGEMNNNPEGTLDRIAGMGYNWIEAAGYNNGLFYNMEPADFRLMVESRGLRLISSHSSLNNENLESSINHAAEAGLEYIVIPSLPGDMISTVDGVKRAADFMNRAGFMGREFGVKIGFHNHLIEFQEIEGEKPYDILLNNTEKDLVVFELDLAWITAGGADPLSYFKKNPGRFEIWHVKDLSIEKEDATLGEGTIDFTPIFAAAEGSGMKYFFIEQDNCVTHTPLESIEISRNYLISSIL